MPSRYPRGSRFPSKTGSAFHHHRRNAVEVGEPKFHTGDTIGEFTIERYMGHSDVNKRNNHIMAKPQHWYRCQCSCGTQENRSQQELIDVRRSQCCFQCRANQGETDEDTP